MAFKSDKQRKGFFSTIMSGGNASVRKIEKKNKKVDRIMIHTLKLNNKLYGQNKKGEVFQQVVVPIKIKGTKDDYKLMKTWHKLHYMSYEKGKVLLAFKKKWA